MSKVTFSFSLPEEREEYEIAAAAGKMHSALWEFSQWLRTNTKYWNEESGLNEDTLEKVKEEFWRTLNDEDIGSLF